MNIVKTFFTEMPNTIEMLSIILGISFIGSLLFRLLPEERALKWLFYYRSYSSKKEEYDWSKTLKKQTVFLALVFIYSSFILFSTYIYGKNIANIGIWVLAALVFIGSFWLGPIKKE